MSKEFRIPVESKAWIRRSGSEVVLLKDMAGVSHDGNLNSLVSTIPRSIEREVYAIDHIYCPESAPGS